MYARITRGRVKTLPIKPEDLAPIKQLMGTVSVMAGHQGAFWLLNRETGDAVAIDFYRSHEDLDNTSQGDLRDAIAEALAIEVTDIGEYEVVGTDRMPSLA